MPPCEKCKLWNVTRAIRPSATIAALLIDGLQTGMEAEDCPRATGFRHLVQQFLPSRPSPYLSLGEIAHKCDNSFLTTEAAKPLLQALIIFDDENRG